MAFFYSPESPGFGHSLSASTPAAELIMGVVGPAASNVTMAAIKTAKDATPQFGELSLLVLEAVMEVVCVSLPGYIIARSGHFDGPSQKFVASLNMNLFTPCLIFSKLAAQLSVDKLAELVIIPFILLVQTLISWAAALIVCRLFGLKKQPQLNFVTAMSVFGNSNSLPLSLVVSLSKTISGLHWDKLPGDTDNDVGARGILYLLVFSQLGQALRWSWGMNALLKPLHNYNAEDAADEETRPLVEYEDNPLPAQVEPPGGFDAQQQYHDSTSSSSTADLPTIEARSRMQNGQHKSPYSKPYDGNLDEGVHEVPDESSTWWKRVKRNLKRRKAIAAQGIKSTAMDGFSSLPPSSQKGLTTTGRYLKAAYDRLIYCMNPPLIAIIFSVIVAVIPPLQALFFTPHTFVNNSVTRAITQSGLVAVPLILVVLGANLARNTIPDEGNRSKQYRKEENKMLVASIVCRMFITILFMAPILALTAKFVPVSILDDPIFLIVCFMLAGAPSALQLAQMCQVNGVFVGAVSRLLFYSYVVLILPSTLFLVVTALEVVNWARR